MIDGLWMNQFDNPPVAKYGFKIGAQCSKGGLTNVYVLYNIEKDAGC